MTDITKATNTNVAKIGEMLDIELAECQVADQADKVEGNTMFEMDESVVVNYADRTYHSEYELRRFLATLSDAQRAETEVIVDDDSFVVFYPLLADEVAEVEVTPVAPRSGYHFDTDSIRPTVVSADVPELIGGVADQFQIQHQNERATGLAVLLASVRL